MPRRRRRHILAIIYIPPALVDGLRWRLPAFREASLGATRVSDQFMLKNGVSLPEALALAEMLETKTPAAETLAHWRSLLADGKGKPAAMEHIGHPFPSTFSLAYPIRRRRSSIRFPEGG